MALHTSIGVAPTNAASPPPAPPKFDLDDTDCWQTLHDPNGVEYYHHKESGYVTWQKPWISKDTEGAPAPVVELSDAWTRHFFQELVGSLIAQVLTSGVAWSAMKNAFDAFGQASSLSSSGVATDGYQFVFGLQFWNQLTFAFGISMAYAVGIGVSYVGQLNPAFSFAMALLGAKKWRHVG